MTKNENDDFNSQTIRRPFAGPYGRSYDSGCDIRQTLNFSHVVTFCLAKVNNSESALSYHY